MQFKIKDVKIKISFTFFAFLLILFCLNKINILVVSILSAALHEFGHLLFLKLFNVNITEFSLSLFGANIKNDLLNKTDYLNDVLIYFAGPFFNLIIYFIFLILFKNYRFFIFKEIYLMNIFLVLFNLLPFYNFDGGKIIGSFLKKFLNETIAENILTIISIIILIIIIPVSLSMFFKNQQNFHLVLLSGFMALTLLLKK